MLRLPLVEKHVSEYHFLIDFPNRATDAKYEVNIQPAQYYTLHTENQSKEKQSQEKKICKALKKLCFPTLLLFFRCSHFWFSIRTFHSFQEEDSRKHEVFRVLRRIHFFQKGIPCVDCNKADALLYFWPSHQDWYTDSCILYIHSYTDENRT